jgi:HrpA-like RNA helicase
VVTQPRRISAVSIAERVAEEQCQTVGQQQIGYQVRLDAAKNLDTQLLFMTPGVLLRQMQSSPLLLQYTTIIIDEIHERDKYQEFLLIVLRDLIPLRPDLRVILMSATLQTVTLVEYFESCQPAVIEMQGRMFPVQEFFLEHVLELTHYVDVDGDDNGTGTATGSSRLEAELAKLLLEQKQDRYVPTLQCMMCGKTGFLDGVELGAHVGLCAVGVPDVVGDDDDDNDALVKADDDPRQTPNVDDAAEMEFEDYNVDEEIVLEDFDTNILDGYNSNGEAGRNRAPSIHSSEAGDEIIIGGDASVNGTTKKKWDGKSPFEAAVETEIELSPRQENMLEQYQGMHDDEQIDNFLLLEVLRYIVKSSRGDGAILVFLPGWQEISEFSLVLEYNAPFSNRSKFFILPLHSGIPSKDQRRVLRRPPEGTRKIVLSTNLAETSLTIDDIAFVVDTGRAKEKNYDPHLKTSTLQSTWISQASAKQRKGRAGRTKAGVCFHLFSSRRHGSLRPYTESELLRTPLVRLRF